VPPPGLVTFVLRGPGGKKFGISEFERWEGSKCENF
jgi:hypothetical protein